MIRPTSLRALAVLLPAILLASCAGTSAPTQFYTLATTVEAGGAPKAPAGKKLFVGVGPVTLADYLDRPQIVVRGSAYKVSLADFDQWAGPLDTGLPTVLVGDLAALMPQDDVVMVPQPFITPLDYQVRINVSRFDIDGAGNAVTEAQWQVYDVKKSTVVATQNSVQREPAGAGTGTEAGVAALSRTLGALSREMAKAIAAAAGRPAP
ncbi:MAG: PqiC family protein [Alphaproteobacteria bacterium]